MEKLTAARHAAWALLLAPASALAQIAPPPPAPAVAPIPAPAGGNAVLRVGTEVPLRLSEELTTKGKQLKVGQRFRMEVAEPVLVQGVTVIPSGSPAVGELTDVRNKGMWGKSGRIAGRILYLTVNGRQIRLSGALTQKGTAGGVAAVGVSAVVFAPAGFFMTGTSARLPIGTPVKAFVDEDVPLTMAAAAPAPLPVAASAAPMAVTPAAAPLPAGSSSAASAAQVKAQAATAAAPPAPRK